MVPFPRQGFINNVRVGKPSGAQVNKLVCMHNIKKINKIPEEYQIPTVVGLHKKSHIRHGFKPVKNLCQLAGDCTRCLECLCSPELFLE